MNEGRVPFLWLCGPSGVGKSAVGFEIFGQMHRAGVRTGFVDADQLGLCYPAPADDPDTHRIKAANLGAVWSTFRTAGIRCFVMAGSADTGDIARSYAERVPGVALTLCRLRVDRAELVNRYVGRGWQPDMVDEAVAEADALDRSDFTDLCVDTGRLTVPEVARLVRERAGGWPELAPAGPAALAALAGPAAPAHPVGAPPAPVLWVCGPTGVGKSTVGWTLVQQVVRSGTPAAYVDLGQLGFCRPVRGSDPDNHRIRAASLGAVWPNFRAAGARCLVVVGAVTHQRDVDAYADALPGTELTLCRLRAAPDRLTERIVRRGRGDGPPLPGDELAGKPTATLRRTAQQAAHDAADLDRTGPGDLHVDTDRLTATEVADLIRARTGQWPAVPR